MSLLAPSLCADVTFSVSDPTADSLLKTLDDIREMRRGGDRSAVAIRLAAGVYRLRETLPIDSELVGQGLMFDGQGGNVSAAGATSVRATLSGARLLDDGRRDGNQWRYELPDNAPATASRPRVIIVDGQLRMPARHPNVGYHRIVQSAADRRSGFQFAAEDLPADLDLTDGLCDLVFLHDWSSSRLPVASIDRTQRFLATVGPIGCSADHYAIDHFEKQPRYYLEGHPALADRPGEWFVDTRHNELVVVAGSEDRAPVVELPWLETLVSAIGSDAALTDLHFVGMRFTGTCFPMPEGGVAGAQATMHEPRDRDGKRLTDHRPMLSAAVYLERTERAEFSDCRFQSLGNTALWVGGRCNASQIHKCEFSDLGGNAINMGEDNHRHVDGKPWYQSAPEQVPRGNQIRECRISDCGVVLPGSVAIWAPLNHSLSILNNQIVDCPYTGISLGWIWNDTPSPAGKNRIANNRIDHVMQVLSDGGGIYTLGRQPGSQLVGNVVTNVPLNAGRAESNGFFMDEGSSGFEVFENEFRRIARSPLRFHRAGNNRVHNNRWELETDETPPVRYNNTPEQNIELEDNRVLKWEPRIYLIGNSLTWDTRPSLLDHYVDWHVDCGKSLRYIEEHPADPCVGSSRLWPTALAQLQYDYLVMQPHYGTTLGQDVETIARWMQMQPRAIVVIHNGWARNASEAEEFAAASSDQMGHRPEYFQHLIDELKQRFPERQIRQTFTTHTLHQISQDIEAGNAPLEQLDALYRDAIHMTHGEGRYLMHNLMRLALDQSPSSEGFTIERDRPELKSYLDNLIRSRQ